MSEVPRVGMTAEFLMSEVPRVGLTAEFLMSEVPLQVTPVGSDCRCTFCEVCFSNLVSLQPPRYTLNPTTPYTYTHTHKRAP